MQPDSLLTQSGNGRQRKSLAPSAKLLAVDDLRAKGILRWRHHHHESPETLNYGFAAIAPKLGKLILTTIYSMSGKGNIIESYATAKSYCSYIAPFFRWLRLDQVNLVEVLEQKNGALTPKVFSAYKSHLGSGPIKSLAVPTIG